MRKFSAWIRAKPLSKRFFITLIGNISRIISRRANLSLASLNRWMWGSTTMPNQRKMRQSLAAE